MKFHPLYAGRFAMGLSDLTADAPGIIATQSTHKQLASFSQASQIHMKDRHIKGQKRRVEHRRFNESFMQHASTSPFYPLFASLDVGAQMMKGRSGEVLWDDTIRLGIELRKKIRATRREFEEKEARPERRWFFEPFVPDRVQIPDMARPGAMHDVAWETVSTDELATNPSHLGAGAGPGLARFPRHGAGVRHDRPQQADAAHAGLRPIDRSLCGARNSGSGGRAISAREPHRRREERPQFAAVPADARRRSQQGRHADQRAHCLQEAARRQRAAGRGDPGILPAQAPALCRGAGARPVRGHARFFREADVSALQSKQFAPEHLPEIALSPHDATRCLVRNDVDYLPIDAIAGRIATTPFVVYPPGIATIVPGERLTERAKPMIDYLKMFETCFNTFPGFEVEIQGVYREVDASGRIRLHTYVVAE